jgi:hypothetical protein
MNAWACWLRRSAPQSQSRRRLEMMMLEGRSAPTIAATSSTAVESITGVGNNLAHSRLGSAGADLIRIATAACAATCP